MKRKSEQKEVLLHLSSHTLWCFLPCGLLPKVYLYSRSHQAREGKKDPVKASNASLGGHAGGVGGGTGRCYWCLCCSVCTPGKLAAAGGSLWRAFHCTLSSCSRGLKMGIVIGNFIQLLTARPKEKKRSTQLPKRKNVALVRKARLAWNRQM